jgi:MFS transporter, DHA2 family, lincomycin resistance protein
MSSSDDVVGRKRLAPASALVIGLLIASAFHRCSTKMMLGVALPVLITDLRITPSRAQW